MLSTFSLASPLIILDDSITTLTIELNAASIATAESKEPPLAPFMESATNSAAVTTC